MTPPRICLVHNNYTHPGGKDAVYFAERAVLLAAGHEVDEFRDENRRIPPTNQFNLAFVAVWSRQSHRQPTSMLSGCYVRRCKVN